MKSENILISVGMPVYNGEKYLDQAIGSILNQTYTNLELIIADDHSSDNSASIYESYAKKDSRIRIIRHKKNIGSIPNFNYVLKQAKGDYFLWAAQDDYRSKDALNKLIKLHLANPKAAVAVSNYKNVHGKNTYFVYQEYSYQNNASTAHSLIDFLKTNNLSFFYGLHKTKMLQKTGGYVQDSRPIFKSSDFLAIYKVLLEGKLVYTPEVLFFKRDTGLYTKQFEAVQNNLFASSVIAKIMRYLYFPLFFLYDFVYASYFLWNSSFSFSNKLKVQFYVVLNIANKYIGFILNLVKGVMYFTKGLLK